MILASCSTLAIHSTGSSTEEQRVELAPLVKSFLAVGRYVGSDRILQFWGVTGCERCKLL